MVAVYAAMVRSHDYVERALPRLLHAYPEVSVLVAGPVDTRSIGAEMGGVPLFPGTRVALAAQPLPSDNGIYYVADARGRLERSYRPGDASGEATVYCARDKRTYVMRVLGDQPRGSLGYPAVEFVSLAEQYLPEPAPGALTAGEAEGSFGWAPLDGLAWAVERREEDGAHLVRPPYARRRLCQAELNHSMPVAWDGRRLLHREHALLEAGRDKRGDYVVYHGDEPPKLTH
jgi:hypothetical protein